MASDKDATATDDTPANKLSVSVQQVTIGSRYAIPKPKIPDDECFALPPITAAAKKKGMPKRPPNVVPIYAWRHKIDSDTKPFGPLIFERMPSRYERKKKDVADVEILVSPEKKKKPMMTLSIDSTMQIDEKMIVAKLIQAKLFKTIRTMKKDRKKSAAIRATRKVRAANRAKAAATASKQYANIPPIVAQGRNCLVRTLPLGRPRCPSQEKPTYKWIIANRKA